MPDDAAVGLTTVAADELTEVNGVAQSEPLPKAQRVRPVFGPDGVAWDVSADQPFPTTDAAVAQAVADLAAALGATPGPVALDAASLTALESITATISGPVEVDNASGGPLGVKQTGIAPPLGYQQIAALTASQLLPTIPGAAVTAIVTPRAPVRWRDDGTAPTASVGMYLAADQALTYQGNLAALRLIAVSGSVEVNVSYYGAEA
jgi:hypothetical protein